MDSNLKQIRYSSLQLTFGGRTYNQLGMLEDVTEHRLAEDKLQQTLESMGLLKASLLAMTAHFCLS